MKIAFASCMNLECFPEQQIWAKVAAEEPDYLFLLGDQIYMDYFPHLGAPAGWSDDKFQDVMTRRYKDQWAEPHFHALIQQLRQRQDDGGGVYGTWDDHDFAWNNSNGRNVPESKKRIARGLFAEFVRGGAPVADRIFYSVPLREGAETRGKAIFLDTRSYRDEPGDEKDLLGEEQFDFLNDEMKHSLPLTVVCAGTPMRATGKGWLQYRRDYLRFLKIIGDRKVIFLSGDIHENVFIPPTAGTRLYEIISSGAAVKKYAFVGKRRNYGLLEWSPERTRVKLVDRRGSLSYTISNDSFQYEEHEPQPN
jgi:alkaline phosphatase D